MVFAAHPITDSEEAFNRDAWLDSLRATYAATEVDLIAQALDSAAERTSFAQSLGTANVLASLSMDYQTVAAALAAYAPLETEQQRNALKALLGPDVARLVEGVSRMGQLHRAGIDVTLDEGKKTPVNQAEALRKMLLAMAEDVRVVLIVLADQVQMLRGWIKSDDPARERAAQEAQEIFAPLANRLGIWQNQVGAGRSGTAHPGAGAVQENGQAVGSAAGRSRRLPNASDRTIA